MTRVIEKAHLKGKGRVSAACVKDIVRAMIIAESMKDIVDVLEILSILQKNNKIQIVRLKERFLEQPSGGGWRGKHVGIISKCLNR